MNDLFGNVYKGKKVLITGHTGFKGSWLSLWLDKLGAKVIGYSIDIPTQPNHFELLDIKMVSVVGDILDKRKLYKTICKYEPDIIFHLAAQPLVKLSYSKPIETLEINIIGTANILESCRKVKNVKAIVVITSDKCYQNREINRGYKETDPMGGYDTYSASKGCAELVISSYRESFHNLKDYNKTHTTLISSARAGNVIGGGDWAIDRLIPDIIRATTKNKKVIIRSPNAVRPWQHVLESLSGYLVLGQKLLEGQVDFADGWNFGPSDKSSITVREVLEHSKKHWSKINYDLGKTGANVHEANLLKLDSAKAYSKLGWRTVWDTNKTLEKTINWYKHYYKDGTILSEKDLDDYIRDAKKLSTNTISK